MRRFPTIALGLALLAWAGWLRAAQVVVVVSADLPPYLQAAEGVKSALADLPDGSVAVLSLGGEQERWTEVAERIRQEGPRVVVPVGSLATVLAAKRLDGPRVVYSMILNPSNLLGESATTGRVTGVSMNVPASRVFEEIRSALPAAHRVGILYDPSRSRDLVEEARAAAAAAGLELVAEEVADQRDLPTAVRNLCDSDIDALWLFVDRTVLQTREGLELIMLETLRKGIPVVAPSQRYVKAGALLAMSVDYTDLGRQTGTLVRRMLMSAQPTPAPQRPRMLTLSVNDKVREALKIQLPPSFRERVSDFIE